MKLASQHYSQDLARYYRMPAVKVSLTLVLSVFVIAIFVIFALRPTILSIATLTKTIEESRSTLKKLDTKVSNLQKAATELESFKAALPKLNLSIPNLGADYSPLTVAVESLATTTGVTIESETLGPTLLYSRILSPFLPSKSQSVVELPFSVRVNGSYSAVSLFLQKLITMERIISLESVIFTNEAGAKSTETSVAVNISGKAFYLADQAQIEKATAIIKGSK